jgi:hypothetical protein
MAPAELVGAVLLAPVRPPAEPLAKGTRLDREQAVRLVAAATDGALARPVRLAWPDPDDVHEEDAASRLALVVGGAGVEPRASRQSRLDLAATWDGVLHIRTEALRRLNAIDPLEVFTLFHGQAVSRGQVVCSVKVAPHVLPGATLTEGLRLARAEGPIVEVRPYRPTEVGAIAVEAMTPDVLARFEAGARAKVEALGGTFGGTVVVADDEPDRAEAAARDALETLVRQRALPIVLVGGVSAGDPLSPFYAALERSGGTVLRRGVPAHPGSMIWLARLDRTQLLGLPQCGMFSLATAADLVLPRLFTGEALTAESLADLAHGGLLGREMRFRMPGYARDLPGPEEE